MSRQFRNVLAEQLDTIDRMLAKRELPVSQRPLEAAYLFATKCIVEINSKPPKEPIEQRWFGDLLRWTQDWYIQRYGAKRVERESHVADGLVVIFDTPFKLAIPTTVTEPTSVPDVVCMMFPSTVLPQERVLDWIVDPPNLAQLQERVRADVENDVRAVVTCTRSLDMSLATADLENAVARQMAANVPAYISQAVDAILTTQDHRMSAAVWDLFLAVEMTTKALLYQLAGTAPRTHSLPELLRQLGTHGIPAPPQHLLTSFPSASDAIQHRYGEGNAPTLDHVNTVYRVALELAEHLSRSLRRTLEFSEGRFFIRKLPWARTHGKRERRLRNRWK